MTHRQYVMEKRNNFIGTNKSRQCGTIYDRFLLKFLAQHVYMNLTLLAYVGACVLLQFSQQQNYKVFLHSIFVHNKRRLNPANFANKTHKALYYYTNCVYVAKFKLRPTRKSFPKCIFTLEKSKLTIFMSIKYVVRVCS